MSPAEGPDWKALTVRAHFQMLAAGFALAAEDAEDLAAAQQAEAMYSRHTNVAGPLAHYAHRIDRLVRHTRENGHVLSSLEYELFGAVMDGARPRA